MTRACVKSIWSLLAVRFLPALLALGSVESWSWVRTVRSLRGSIVECFRAKTIVEIVKTAPNYSPPVSMTLGSPLPH